MLSLRNSINRTVLLLLLASVCHKFVFVHVECVITPMIQSEHNFFKCRLAIVGFIIVYKENHILFPIHYSSNPLWFYMFCCNVNCVSTFILLLLLIVTVSSEECPDLCIHYNISNGQSIMSLIDSGVKAIYILFIYIRIFILTSIIFV